MCQAEGTVPAKAQSVAGQENRTLKNWKHQCGWRAENDRGVLGGETGTWQGKAKRHVKYFL